MEQGIAIKSTALSKMHKAYGLPFYLTLCYLALEYGRPQDKIPGVASLHLPMIVVILLILTMIGTGRIGPIDSQTKLFISLLVFMAVHIPFAVNNYWAFQTTKDMLITFAAYLAIIVFVDSFQKFQTMITAWIGIHLYLAIAGIMAGGTGIGGFLSDENDFAMTLNMAIPFSFFLAMESRSKLRSTLLLVATGIFLVCVGVTLSRGGFLGLVAVGSYCWMKSPGKIKSTAIVLMLFLAVLLFTPSQYWDEVATIKKGSSDPTGASRIENWGYGWLMFLDHPLIGVGPGNYPTNVNKYEPPRDYSQPGVRSKQGRAAHSLYFTLIPELGTAGVVIFILMLNCNRKQRKEIIMLENREKKDQKVKRAAETEIADVLADELRNARYLCFAIGGALLGYLVSGTFISVLYYPNFWVLLAFTTALKNVVTKRVRELRANLRCA